MYKGAIIKETLSDELLLDYLTIDKVDIWKTDDIKIKYWTMIFFHSEIDDLPQRLANSIIENYYADMKRKNTKYIIFKNKVLSYEIGNISEKEKVLNYCRSVGIAEKQLAYPHELPTAAEIIKIICCYIVYRNVPFLHM